MSKCLKLYISVPLFSSSILMMYKVCALVFSITCSSSTDFSDAMPWSVRYPKREEGSDYGTHTVTRRRGSFNLMTQRWRTFCVWPYILRIPSSSSTLYISQLDSNAIHTVKHSLQESKQPTVCRLGSRKPTIYYLKYTTSYFVTYFSGCNGRNVVISK